ncbi:MAG: ATP-binding protein [Flavobacteriaceae bacterium]|nr:ATP-binding protein [Flavobacteriaceae bacterium]
MKSFTSYFTRWGVFLLFTFVVVVFAGASIVVIDRFKRQEIQRIKVIATSMKFLQDEQENDSRTLELILAILKDNNSIPVILTDENKKPILEIGTYRNIPEDITKDPKKVEKLIQKMERSYEPFLIKMPNGKNQYIFYSNSKLLDQLQYYPFVLALFVGGYLMFSFLFFRTIKRKEENILWAGLAKETAHQIGTPLSSMMGWIEILKLEYKDNEGVKEIGKDIQRLAVISERFSKIGSVPELNELNLKETLQQNYDYLKPRISSRVDFELNLPKEEILIPHSKILMSWVVENLVKNAVDAMKGEGRMEIFLFEKEGQIILDFKDNGCGMSKKQMRNAFKTGYSTKKRGWGLGLSLVKRVVRDYHNGDIKILSSELGKGTTFRIYFKN